MSHCDITAFNKSLHIAYACSRNIVFLIQTLMSVRPSQVYVLMVNVSTTRGASDVSVPGDLLSGQIEELA